MSQLRARAQLKGLDAWTEEIWKLQLKKLGIEKYHKLNAKIK